MPRPGTGSQTGRLPAAPVAQHAAPTLIGRPCIRGKFFDIGAQRLRWQGVTYGPFAPDVAGHQFPPDDRLAADFTAMADLGINSIRVYHAPPPRLFRAAEQSGRIGLFVDIPWSKHLCFLDSSSARAQAREAVRQATSAGREFDCAWAYSIGNEIPADIVRWHGARRVERFLRSLYDVGKDTDPNALLTYANFPPTEYLDLSFLDFATFNVYLHDRETFRRYLFRLQNFVGDRPLVLGELGMDTIRQGEPAQASFLAGHLKEAAQVGVAGSYVFAWTDDWFTGGHPIENWAFGITDKTRQPKLAAAAVSRAYHSPPRDNLVAGVKVSVVVCSYNGGRTLRQCLESLLQLDYADYEIIVVDDGSTDNTAAILADFPTVRVIKQPNQGLSVSRNQGLYAAQGDIVAYTDSDCYVDRDWLTHLVGQLEQARLKDCRVAGVGGPNLSPDDGATTAVVAAAPGQPMHVLESDQVAEHIPGCNMAFWREPLLQMNGFDPRYHAAGDDVDICWRLQQAGYWLTFAPAAFVWHHRRATPQAYFKQQSGYGEAEALLRFQHPERFTDRGHGKWRGILYGPSLQGLILERPIIYHGTFCVAPFQCVYQPTPAHWAMIPVTLEWHILALSVASATTVWFPALWLAIGMWCASLLIAAIQAKQAKLPPRYEGVKSRVLLAGLCYLQPLVRSWARYKTRYFSGRLGVAPRRQPVGEVAAPTPPNGHPIIPAAVAATATIPGELAFWGQGSPGRTDLLARIIDRLDAQRWRQTLDSGWTDMDLEVFRDPWDALAIRTVQEEHGEEKRVIRVKLTPHLGKIAWGALLWTGLLTAGAGLWHWAFAAVGIVVLALAGLVLYSRRRKLRAAVAQIVSEEAAALGLIRCDQGSAGRVTSPPQVGP